ncbi:MAG: hypothetical protein Q8O76_15155, partial [Chloroflexota bacterium]|nr:hypothetical protein [Chloroflexota bacterium]
VALGVQPGFLVTPTAPARFFLEVNAGEAEGVQAGDSVLIEPQEAVAVDNGGVASIVNFGVSMGILGLVMGALGTVVRAALPRPRGEMLPATITYETWEFTFKNLKTGEEVKLREFGKSLHEASVKASQRVRTEIEGLGPEEVSTTWALMGAEEASPAGVELLPQTAEGISDWTAVYEDTRTGEMADFNFKAGSRQDAAAIAPRRFETYIRRGMLAPPMRMWKLRDLRVAGVRFIGGCKVLGASGFCETHDEPATEKVRCRKSDLTDEEWRMAWDVAEEAFPGAQQPPGGLELLPQVEAVPVEGWRPKSMQQVDAAVAKYANAMRQGLEKYRARAAHMVERYRGSVEKAVDSYRRYLIGEYRRGGQRPALAHLPSPGVAVMPKLPPEARGDVLFFEDIRDRVRLGEKLTDEDVRRIWEARKKRPVLVPAVIGPRERRQAPEELEFFADSAEQLLASTNPYRAQMDTAFREAIERIRAGDVRR